MDVSRELDAAREAVRRAAAAIMEIYGSETADVEAKADGSPVTQADLRANEIIGSVLRARFPSIPLLTEEEADDRARLDSDEVWIVDPLDGTKEFISRNGEFTVNVALARDGRPVLGVVAAPAKATEYWAAQGGGAWRSAADGAPQRLNVSERSAPAEMILTVSRSHMGRREEALMAQCGFRETLPRGSSLKGCMVASGEADVYFRFGPTHEWDVCAMNAVVDEAGATMTGLDGAPLRYNQAETLNAGFAVSNGTIHKHLLEAAKRCA